MQEGVVGLHSVVSPKYIAYFVSFRGVRPNEVQGGQACPELVEGGNLRNRDCHGASPLAKTRTGYKIAAPFGLATTRSLRTFGIPERGVSILLTASETGQLFRLRYAGDLRATATLRSGQLQDSGRLLWHCHRCASRQLCLLLPPRWNRIQSRPACPYAKASDRTQLGPA